MMQYLVYVIAGVIMLWMWHLCRRSVISRLPGQLGMYCMPGLGAVTAATLMNTLLIGFAIAAAKEAALMSVVMLATAAMYAGLLRWNDFRIIAFSEEKIAVRELFGPVRTYRWTDVSAYTVRREETRGRFSHTYDMYRLTLPDCVLAISTAEDAGRALLQVLERRRPELNAVRQGEQNK